MGTDSKELDSFISKAILHAMFCTMHMGRLSFLKIFVFHALEFPFVPAWMCLARFVLQSFPINRAILFSPLTIFNIGLVGAKNPNFHKFPAN